MPYTPPTDDALNFNFAGSHTDPLGNAVNFAFAADGTLAATETGSDTAAINVTVGAVTASLDATESGSDTAAIDVAVDTLSATLDTTEAGSDTAAIDITVEALSATLAATESGSDTAAIDITVAGSADVTATLDTTESGSDTAAIDITVEALSATLAATESSSDTAVIDIRVVPPWDGHTAAIKIAGAAVVETADTDAIKIAGSVVVENDPTSAFKIAGAVILESAFIQLPNPPHKGPVPQRCPVGMAEYTETTGLYDGYLVKGAIPGFETLRSQLRDHEYVRYRVTNSQKEEVGEGWFDWRANTLMRTRFIVPTSGIDWLPGRKILHIIEDYTNDVCEGAVIANSPLSIGIAEYTTTTGVGPYQLRGSVREFFTLRGRIPGGSRVRYRATNIAKEEVSEGIFDASNNQLLRNVASIPTAPINWGPGRKLIYIIEK